MTLFPGEKDGPRRWIEALRKAVAGERLKNLHRCLNLEERNLRECLASGDVCKALGPCLADALLEWARFEAGQDGEYPQFESLVREGWTAEPAAAGKSAPISKGLEAKGVSPAAESRRITIAQAYCMFFREHLKHNAKVFRISETRSCGRGTVKRITGRPGTRPRPNWDFFRR